MKTKKASEGKTLLVMLDELIKKAGNTACLARQLEVPYHCVFQTMNGLREKSKWPPSLWTLLLLSRGISKLTGEDSAILFARWCKEVGRENVSRRDIEDLEEKMHKHADTKAQSLARRERTARELNRPTYEVSGPGFPCVFTHTYTLTEEEGDIKDIEQARNNGCTHENARKRFNRMKLTGAHNRIGFTEDESCLMELNFHLHKMQNSDSLSDLLDACAFICKGAMPEHPDVSKAKEDKGYYRGWLFHEPDEKKIALLSKTREEIRIILQTSCNELAKRLVDKLRNDYQTLACDGVMTELEKTVIISGMGWTTVGITPAEALTLTQKSMLSDTQRSIQKAKKEQNESELLCAMARATRWGFTWTDIGITPDEAACLQVKAHISELIHNYAQEAPCADSSDMEKALQKIYAAI
jgi:hypothetical protein